MRRAAVEIIRRRIQSSQGFFVAQVQGFVRGVEIGRIHHRMVLIDPARVHELDGSVHVRGKLFVLRGFRRALHKLQVPLADSLHRRVAAVGERSQQVQRRHGLVVRFDQSVRVRSSRFRSKLARVDVIPSVGRQRYAVDGFQILRPRLGELPSHSPQLHHRHTSPVHQNHRHLQQNSVRISHVIRSKLFKRLRAIAAE